MKKIAWSKLIRRTHMYLALFLTPWVMVYGLVTFVLLVLTMGWRYGRANLQRSRSPAPTVAAGPVCRRIFGR